MKPPTTLLTTPSEVVHYYRHAQTSSKWDSFWAGALTVVSLSEMAGPLAGWPTVSSLCFRMFGLQYKPVQIWQMFFVVLVQLLIAGVAAYRWWRTCWPRWLAAWNKKSKSIVKDEAHLRETLLGVFAAVVVWGLATLQVYSYVSSPLEGAASLKATEVFIMLVSAMALTISIVFSPKEHFGVVHPDDAVYERIPQAPLRLELTLDKTNFEKSILLRRTAYGYELCDKGHVIELHTAEHVLINLGVFEKRTGQEVEVSSANVFRALGRFSAGVHLPRSGEPQTLNSLGVDLLIRNLYDKTDLLGVLKNRLSQTMNEYAGPFDSSVKSLLEDFRIRMARYESTAWGGIGQSMRGTAPLHSTAVEEEQLRLEQLRLDRILAEVQAFREEWAKARALQVQAKQEFPQLFNRRLTEGIQEEAGRDGNADETLAMIARLMSWARIQFHVDAFEFIGAAIEAETLMQTATERAAADLATVKEKLLIAKEKRRVEIAATLDTILSKFEPRDLSYRQREIFSELMRMRTMTDFSSNQDEIMRKIEEFQSERPAPRQTPSMPFPQPVPMPLPGPSQNGEGSDEGEIRGFLREQLRTLPAPLLRSIEARKLIEVFVSRHRNSPRELLSRASQGLIVQLSNIDLHSDEPT